MDAKDHITAAARRLGVSEPDIAAGLHLASSESRKAGGLDESILSGATRGLETASAIASLRGYLMAVQLDLSTPAEIAAAIDWAETLGRNLFQIGDAT